LCEERRRRTGEVARQKREKRVDGDGAAAQGVEVPAAVGF